MQDRKLRKLLIFMVMEILRFYTEKSCKSPLSNLEINKSKLTLTNSASFISRSVIRNKNQLCHQKNRKLNKSSNNSSRLPCKRI